MGIDIYYFKSSCSPREEDYIWTIDNASFHQLENFINFYKDRTGKIIDPYGDLKLDINAILKLQECINLYLSQETGNAKLEIFLKIQSILEVAIEKVECIIFYGD